MSRPTPLSARSLLRFAGHLPVGSVSDRVLLQQFVQDRSESAFADLMARHGSMVLAVCRRALRDADAADDAFQATFLVLARKASTVQWRESIAGWLFAVAVRVARKVSVQGSRRQVREGTSTASIPEPVVAVARPADLSDLQAALDDELQHLPERLRVPVVLCYLEGLPQEEAAKRLGVTDGQLRGRLFRAREKLRRQLMHRGFSLTAVLVAFTAAPRAQAVPAVLVASTLRFCTSASSAIPSAILSLTQGVTRDMCYTIHIIAPMVVLIGALVGGLVVRNAEAGPIAKSVPAVAKARPHVPLMGLKARAVRKDDAKQPDDAKGTTVGCSIKAIDAAKGTLVVLPDEAEQETTISATKAPAKITFGGKAIKLEEIKPGMNADLVYAEAGSEPSEIRASWPRKSVKVKAINAADRSLQFVAGEDDGGLEASLPIAADATIVVDELPAGLADLPAGRSVELDLSLDTKSVMGLHAEGDPADVPATIKRFEAATNTLTVSLEVSADDRVERVITLSFSVAADAKVRHAGKDAKLGDLKENMRARLKMAADRKSVAGLLVGDPLPKEKDDDQ